jgi:lysyl-tRNA synthetase class 2
MVAEPAAAPGRPLLRRWVPTVAALCTALVGLVNLASALTPSPRARVRALAQVLPGTFTHAAIATTAAAGILLLLLALGLRRRKRRAWRFVVALLAGSVVLHVVKGLDIEEAVVAGVLLGGLIAGRREFYAKGDPTTRWRALWVFAILLVTSIGVGIALVEIRASRLVGPHPFSAVLSHVLWGLIGVEGPLRWRTDRIQDLVDQTLLGLGVLTVFTTGYLALRPPEPRPHLEPADEERMRALLDRHGRADSLGYFALRRDKSVVWSPTGKSAIAYRVVSGVMLASGDPLGDPEAWPGAIGRFLQIADEHAWVPAVMGCGEQAGTAWARAGLNALEIGDEAVVEVADFSLAGRAMRNVRQAVGRVERAGYGCDVRRVRDYTVEQIAELRRQADAWRGAETERGFSMALSRFGDPADGDCVAVSATQDGRLRAFLHFVPWGPDGLSLDLMRRDKDADNGLNEYLIVNAFTAAPALGVTRLSLNFAVFRSALERGERLGAGPVLRTWRRVLLFASRWFQIESLYRFNAKFRPCWVPRFICYPAAADIPRIAIAALEAEAFLVWPRPSLRRARALLRLDAT